MNSHTKKLNNRRPSQRHTMTGNQKKISCFFALIFGIFKNRQYCAVQKGIRKNLLSCLANPQAVRGGRAKRKSVLFVWQFSIFGGVGNERKMKKFPQISVNFALRGVVGIRGRNFSAALAESPSRPSRVSENSMRNFRRNATNQPRKAG